MLTRYSTPTEYDLCDFGTVCKTINLTKPDYDLYLQISKDSEKPIWEHVGTFKNKGQPLSENEINKILKIKNKYTE